MIKHDGSRGSKSYVIQPQNMLTIYQNPALPLKIQGLFGNIHNKPQEQIHQIYQKEIKEKSVFLLIKPNERLS